MFRLRFHRAAATLAAGLCVATATAVVPQAARAATAAPAVSAQPCYGPSCVGKPPTLSNANGNCVQGAYDPYLGTWAEGAYDVASTSITGFGSVTLRYSPLCAANWARWNGGNPYVDYWVETGDGTTASGYSGNAPNYTVMVDGTQLARVCMSVAGMSNCSAWY